MDNITNAVLTIAAFLAVYVVLAAGSTAYVAPGTEGAMRRAKYLLVLSAVNLAAAVAAGNLATVTLAVSFVARAYALKLLSEIRARQRTP